VLKDARSPEKLVAETALFLHRAQASLPEPQRRMLEQAQADDVSLAGRKVLIVDDDLRNIFALSSVLERQQMKVLYAENGRDGIEVLQADPAIEIVLMDIMMPEMDGYATMRAIRALPKFKSLPIITLTAKAMKGDRDKCIAAGASDYITKPVDVAQLLSLMRVWMQK
jgi:CheY-like chemotaxis protein